jgi:hypothetical protein
VVTADAERTRRDLRDAGAARVGVNRHTIAGMPGEAGIPKTEVAKLLGMSTTRLYDLLAKPTVVVSAIAAEHELNRRRAARQLAASIRRKAREARLFDREAAGMLEVAAAKLAAYATSRKTG